MFDSTAIGDIRFQIWDNNDPLRNFMTYGANDLHRLYIHVQDVNTEVIYFGFRQDDGDVYYRLLDPLGNVVLGPTLCPATGAGRIPFYKNAINGPKQLNNTNGYTALTYTPSLPGDYYIEFNPVNPNVVNQIKRTFRYFDVTVGNKITQTAINGRVYSKAFDFNCMSFTNKFEASVYIYATDSILTKVKFNGMQPFGFVILSNPTGTDVTGSVDADRKSKIGNVNYPQYKLFLTNPEPISYPPTNITPTILGQPSISGCFPNIFLNIRCSHNGVIDSYLELNGTPGFQPNTRDRRVYNYVTTGDNSIPFNATDGLGAPLLNGTNFDTYITYLGGLTHLPLYDVENHTGGYTVTPIAPSGSIADVYYDDSNIPGGTIQNTPGQGCIDSCHKWSNNFGNVNTLNTWWVTHYDFRTVNFTIIYNCKPIAVDDAANVSRNQTVTLPILNNDADPEVGQTITPSIISGAKNGIATLVNGQLVYTPTNNYTGKDSVIYKICDNGTPVLCDTAVVRFFVECDDDGISATIEGTIDSDGDGQPNSCDIDSDNDGILDSVEGTADSDGDGVINMLDLDSDNDGIPDAIEANNGVVPANFNVTTKRLTGIDSDADGLINTVDNAPNAPYGLGSTSTILNPDADGDGKPNAIDIDADNDGITDILEAGGVDVDFNGRVDNFVDIGPKDGFIDAFTFSAANIANTDGTGRPNFLDADSDGDGIADNIEAQVTSNTILANATFTDTDGNGLADQYESVGGKYLIPVDTDRDGVADYRDLDADGDTILDILEGNDANKNGVADTTPSGLDTDNDGIDNTFDALPTTYSALTNTPRQNSDTDTERDWRDLDDDGDGKLSIDEKLDLDLNGIPDYLEIDACGNRFIPITKIGNIVSTFSSAGTITNVGNAIGVPNGVSAIFGNGGVAIYRLSDTLPIGTTVIITLRKQTNVTGNTIRIEQGLTTGTFTNTVNNINLTTVLTTYNYTITAARALYLRISRLSNTVDVDGITYSFQKCSADFDNDNVLDIVDADDDNDGLLDINEYTVGLPDPDADADADGVPNYLDAQLAGRVDSNADGVDDRYDFDKDGKINTRDLDSDNDGIPDAVEANAGSLPANMGPNGAFSGSFAASNDANGDGFVDGTSLADVDTDSDGKKDRLDLDSDGDGIVDAVEANNGSLPVNMDSNGQYPAVYAKANDTDNDGLINAIDPDNGGTPLLIPDTDSDNLKDYRDLNADNDALLDVQEGSDPSRTPVGIDTDGDGIDNTFDSNNGGIPDNLPDGDSDGIPDYLDKCLVSVQSGAWDNPATWGGVGIPACNTCVVINHDVSLSQSSCVSDITINCPGTLNFNSNLISVKGDFINNCAATSLFGNPKIEMSGTKTQTICGNVTLNDLTVNKTGTAPSNTVTGCAGANIIIDNTVTLTSGVLSSTGSASFVFNSTPTYTAGVNGTGTGTLDGNFTMNRYLGNASCEGYVSLGAPFNTTYNDFNNVYYQGFTGTFYPTYWPNTYWYNERVTGDATNGYTTPNSTANPVPKGRGFMSYQFANTLSNNIALTGPFSMANFTYDNLYGDALKLYSGATNSNIADGYNLIANPFPATIDWKLDAGWSKFGCCDAIYVHNRCLNQYSSYVAGISVNGGSKYIGPLQSFWIKAHRSDASITINRNAIVNTSQQAIYKTYAPILSVLKFKIENGAYTDESAISFGDTAISNGLSSWYGASKFITNVPNYPSFYSIQDMSYGQFNMAINMLPELNTKTKVVQLVCKPGFTGAYTLRFSGIESFDNSYCVMLNDSVTGHWYNLKTDTVLNLNLDSNANYTKRFKVYFNRVVEMLKTNDVCAKPNSGKAIAKATSSQGIFTWRDANNYIIKTSASNVKFDTLNNLAVGRYALDYVSTTSNFCGNGSIQFEIEKAPDMHVHVNVTNNSNCIQPNGSIVAQAIGGKAPFKFDFSNGSHNPNLSNIKEGKYILSIHDQNDCAFDTLITITGPGRAYADFALSSDTLLLGTNNTVQFTNKATPHIKRTWDFGDSSAMDTNYNVAHIFTKPGLYKIKLQVWADSCDDHFVKTLVVLKPLGLNYLAVSNTLQLYPNPTSDYLHIKIKGEINKVEIFDALGRAIDILLEKDKTSVNVKNLANGMYHLRIFDSENQPIDAAFIKK